jgi:hypothetical protein
MVIARHTTITIAHVIGHDNDHVGLLISHGGRGAWNQLDKTDREQQCNKVVSHKTRLLFVFIGTDIWILATC